MFACEHEGLVPDLITTREALAGRRDAAVGRHRPGGSSGRRRPRRHRRAYAGNPVACAAALAAIDIIEREDLPATPRRSRSSRWRVSSCCATGTPSVRNAVGRMLAIEFVRPGTTVPNPDAAKAVAASANSKGVLTLTCGTFGDVIRLLPPLVITDAQLDDALCVIEGAVDAHSGR